MHQVHQINIYITAGVVLGILLLGIIITSIVKSKTGKKIAYAEQYGKLASSSIRRANKAFDVLQSIFMILLLIALVFGAYNGYSCLKKSKTDKSYTVSEILPMVKTGLYPATPDIEGDWIAEYNFDKKDSEMILSLEKGYIEMASGSVSDRGVRAGYVPYFKGKYKKPDKAYDVYKFKSKKIPDSGYASMDEITFSYKEGRITAEVRLGKEPKTPADRQTLTFVRADSDAPSYD